MIGWTGGYNFTCASVTAAVPLEQKVQRGVGDEEVGDGHGQGACSASSGTIPQL